MTGFAGPGNLLMNPAETLPVLCSRPPIPPSSESVDFHGCLRGRFPYAFKLPIGPEQSKG